MILAAIFSTSLFGFVPSNASSNTTGFQIINVGWGTSTNSISAGPGDSSIPLTVTLDYSFPNTATNVQGLLDLPSGFSMYNGSSTGYSAFSQTIPTGTIFTLTFYSIYLASDMSLGSYSFTLNLSWSAAGYAYILNQTSTFVLSVLGTPEISFEPSSNSLIPGEINNVSLAIENSGSGAATSILSSASSQTAGILSSLPEIHILKAGSNSTYILQVYLPKSNTGTVIPIVIIASYKDPYGNEESTSQTINLYGSNLNDLSLDFIVDQHSLVPGRANNITVTLVNTGNEKAFNIITAVSGSSQSLSIVSDFPKVNYLAPGMTYTTVLSVYASGSASSSPATLTFSASYMNMYGNQETVSQNVGFHVEPSPIISLSITTLSNSVTTGEIDMVSFLVTNTGNTTVFAPTYALSVSQPLVVSGNSSYSSIETSIAPGHGQVFEVYLTASPGSSSGIYSATIRVSFTDQFGTSYNQSYSVAVMLSGSIELVIQNEAYSQNATAVTVTGSILNEGSASADYASVTGQLNGSNTGAPDYVGEISANSPVPFTVTIPYHAQSSSNVGNVSIIIQYKNGLGQTINSTSSSTTALKSTSQILPSYQSAVPNTSNASGIFSLSLLEQVIIITILLVAIGVAIVASIRRKHNKKQPLPLVKSKGHVA